MFCEIFIIFKYFTIIQLNPIIYDANINKIPFFKNCTAELSTSYPAKLVVLLSFGNNNKKTLNFMNNSWNRSKKWWQYFFISISTVNRFACISHNHKVFLELVKLTQIIIRYLQIRMRLQGWINFLCFKKCLYSLLFSLWSFLIFSFILLICIIRVFFLYYHWILRLAIKFCSPDFWFAFLFDIVFAYQINHWL